MDKPLVDIFIPVSAGNCEKFPAALCSALTQTYKNIRVVLWLDQENEILESILDKWWYTPADTPRKNLTTVEFRNLPKKLIYENCERGFVARNPNGPSGTAAIGRQWIFEWSYKSPLVKMLDSDDILTPECISYMVKNLTSDVDGVLCPMVRASACRYADIISGKFAFGHMGSGSLMMRRESMAKVVSEGFVWPNMNGHDKAFIQHCLDHDYKFGHTGQQNFLYIYLKS